MPEALLREVPGFLRTTACLHQLRQSRGTQDNPNLQHTTTQKLLPALSHPLARRRRSEVDDHTSMMRHKNSTCQLLVPSFSSGSETNPKKAFTRSHAPMNHTTIRASGKVSVAHCLRATIRASSRLNRSAVGPYNDPFRRLEDKGESCSVNGGTCLWNSGVATRK
jgi:hypothetical protein